MNWAKCDFPHAGWFRVATTCVCQGDRECLMIFGSLPVFARLLATHRCVAQKEMNGSNFTSCTAQGWPWHGLLHEGSRRAPRAAAPTRRRLLQAPEQEGPRLGKQKPLLVAAAAYPGGRQRRNPATAAKQTFKGTVVGRVSAHMPRLQLQTVRCISEEIAQGDAAMRCRERNQYQRPQAPWLPGWHHRGGIGLIVTLIINPTQPGNLTKYLDNQML